MFKLRTHPILRVRYLVANILSSSCIVTNLSRFSNLLGGVHHGEVTSLHCLTLLLVLVVQLLQPLVLPHDQLLFSLRDHGTDSLVILPALTSRDSSTDIIINNLNIIIGGIGRQIKGKVCVILINAPFKELHVLLKMVPFKPLYGGWRNI